MVELLTKWEEDETVFSILVFFQIIETTLSYQRHSGFQSSFFRKDEPP